MVKKILSGLLALLVIGVFVLLATGCAMATDYDRTPKDTTADKLDNGITIKHLIGNGNPTYILDYVEDSARGYGCFIYDGLGSSGGIDCFKLGE